MDQVDQVEQLWHLTVIRAHGLRRIKPSHPVVTVTLVETGQIFETALDWDGRNLKIGIPHILKHTTPEGRLDVKVWLSDKQNSESHLVGFARTRLKSVARRAEQSSGTNEVVLQLKCTPAYRDDTGLGQLCANGAAVSLRLTSHKVARSAYCRSVTPDLATSSVSDLESNYLSDSSISITPDAENPPATQDSPLLRRRRIGKRGYCSNPSHEDDCCSSAEEPKSPSTPMGESPGEVSYDPDALRILPQFSGDQSTSDAISSAESILARVSPYQEMMDDRCDFASVLSRLTTEWYAVGASLLATIGLYVTIFGYPTREDGLTPVNLLEKRTIAVGSITAGIGLAVDAWLLARYSGVDSETFQRRARDISNDTFFFFCMTCRFPMLCLFVSTCTLTAFLLVVAWNAWSTAVLVVCGIAGAFLTLQYLIYGIGSLIGLVGWLVQGVVSAWRRIPGRTPKPTSPPIDSSHST